MNDIDAADSYWMQRALELARRGEGHVEPNPMVGCVIVSDAKQIGAGFHTRYGAAHAERAAIDDAQNQGHGHRLAGATAYVTLEPCCHQGKTPPCTEALLEAKLGRVVVAMFDPFEKVSGQGIRRLESRGVAVTVGVEQQAAIALNAPYLKRITQQRPWVIGKWAMTLDGKIAARTGHSQWISCEESRLRVHYLRGRVDAILIGIGTALADDPLLTARIENPPRVALRVLIDSTLRLPLSSKLVSTAADVPLLVWTAADVDAQQLQALRQKGVVVQCCSEPDPQRRLERLLEYLVSQYQATNVLVEGGGQMLGSLFDLRQIDQCEVFVAPKIVGGRDSLSPLGGLGLERVTDGPIQEQLHISNSGTDAHISCRFRWL